MAQSQPSAARDQVRNIVPGLIDLSERVLFGEVWERPGLSKHAGTRDSVEPLGRARNLSGHIMEEHLGQLDAHAGPRLRLELGQHLRALVALERPPERDAGFQPAVA